MLLNSLKERVDGARQRALVAVNRELVALYWHLGNEILASQQREGLGPGLIEQLARDLRASYPDMQGFSPGNLRHMRALAQAWPEGAMAEQPAAQLPWPHLCTLLDRVSDPALREWYAGMALQHGWSRNVLAMQIDLRLHQRQGQAVNNFADCMPPARSDLARDVFKDPYIFDFVNLANDARERAVEAALTHQVTRLLLELGTGFAFVGRQYRLDVGGEEFYIDLLFYHLKLRSYVVVELKATPFRPEYAGQLGFYLAAVDAQVKLPDDQPSIGLLLCRDNNRLVAEYALRGMAQPMGVAEYQLMPELPPGLPSIAEIEARLAAEADAVDAAEEAAAQAAGPRWQ
ncbi:PDDEXK nuclease domain-containing protein [Cupriavidus pauculus]|nr:PDDEXK nuclease domain-containing protein [Cupriavidus pauculus]